MRFKYYLRGAGIGVIAATLILSFAFLFHDNISDEEVIRRAMKLGMVMQENNPGTLADPPQSGASSVDLETGTDPQDGSQADADPLADFDGEPSDTDQPSDPDSGAGTDQPSDPDSGAGTGQPSDPDSGADTFSDPDSGTGRPSDPEADGNESGNAGQPSGAKAGGTDKPSGSKADENADSSKDGQTDQKPDHKKDQSDDKKEDSKPEESDEVEIVIAAGDVSRMVSAKVYEAGLVDDADEFNSYLGSNDYDNMLQPGTYKIKKGSSFRQIAKILTRR